MAYAGSATKQLTAQLRLKGGCEAQTLAGNLTLDASSANLLALEPGGGARDVTVPTAADATGLFFIIANTGSSGNSLTVKNPAAATIAVVANARTTFIGSDGTNWISFGILG